MFQFSMAPCGRNTNSWTNTTWKSLLEKTYLNEINNIFLTNLIKWSYKNTNYAIHYILRINFQR